MNTLPSATLRRSAACHGRGWRRDGRWCRLWLVVAAAFAGPAAAAVAAPAPTNRLAREKSPYLLQHAHNPVDWFPWGEEALAKARREDKPIFLSIGYSTCYWCHVMEKESFEDAEVARLLNASFVAIKVDREERPDLDEHYMLATQLITGRGGWPNTLWLTPAGQPWMAGTYFPKPQLVSLLAQLADIWKNRRPEVDGQAARLAQAVADAGRAPAPTGAEPTAHLLDEAARQLLGRFDARAGGFGGAPKFPPHGALALLLRRARDTGDPALLVPVTKTLDAMWLGGIHDHIGGGFHRYSTDARWLLPHFEKMLYDNAQLMRSYTDAFLLTGDATYRDAVADIFRWVGREMTAPSGAFYSAIDSGEVGQEGRAYVWPLDQVEAVLGREDAALFAEVYHLEQAGNYVEQQTGERTGASIPHLTAPLADLARRRGADAAGFAARLAHLRDELLARRLTWPQPHKDDKVLTGWNGLMIGALAHAGRLLHEPRYTAAATRAADFILRTMVRSGTLLRSYRDGEAKLPGYLDDHAYFAQALVELDRADGAPRWLEEADRLAARLVSDFQDEAGGGFYFTTRAHEDLSTRTKSLGGGGNLPDANGVAAEVLLALAARIERPAYRAAGARTLHALAGLMQQNPSGTEHLLLATAEWLQPAPALPAPRRAAAGAAGAAAETEAVAVVDAVSVQRAGPVEIRAEGPGGSVKPGATAAVAVELAIDEGWHLYGENPGADFLLPTSVAVAVAPPLTAGVVERPVAHRARDAVLQEELNTYTGRIRFVVPVTVAADAAPGAHGVTLSVVTQACDASRCLQPQTTVVRVTLRVAAGAE